MQDAPTPRSKAPKPTCVDVTASGASALPQPSSSSLQERFQECKAENSLLGQLLQESQTRIKALEKEVQQERKKCSKATQASKDSDQRAKEARAQAERDAEKLNAATDELQKVRATVTSQAASLRRQKDRTEQLEDVIIDLKHDLDATQATKATAEDALSKAKAAAQQKTAKLKAAEAAAQAARDEVAQERAQQSASSNAAQADIQTLLQSMQKQSESAVRAMEQAHAVQLQDLHGRLDSLQAERHALTDELNSTRSQLDAERAGAQAQLDAARAEHSKELEQQAAGGADSFLEHRPVSQGRRAMSPEATASMQASLEELQNRNHRLQMALAKRATAAPPPDELQEEIASLKALCKNLSAERDDLASALNNSKQACSQKDGAQAAASSDAWAGGQLWNDVLRLTERLAEVAGTNSAVLSENSALTQQVEAAEKSLADARDEIERLACAHVTATVAAATAACGSTPATDAVPSSSWPPVDTFGAARAPKSQALVAQSEGAGAALAGDEVQHRAMREIDGNAQGGGWGAVAGRGGREGAATPAVDVSGTKVRVLECAVRELRGAVEALRQRLQESAALERRVRELLAEARARERNGAQRLAAEAARVHALEIMRMNDLREISRLHQAPPGAVLPYPAPQATPDSLHTAGGLTSMRSQSLPPRPQPPKVSFGLPRPWPALAPGAGAEHAQRAQWQMQPAVISNQCAAAGGCAGGGLEQGGMHALQHWGGVTQLSAAIGGAADGAAGVAAGNSTVPVKPGTALPSPHAGHALGQGSSDPAAFAAAYERVQSMLQAAHAGSAHAASAASSATALAAGWTGSGIHMGVAAPRALAASAGDVHAQRSMLSMAGQHAGQHGSAATAGGANFLIAAQRDRTVAGVQSAAMAAMHDSYASTPRSHQAPPVTSSAAPVAAPGCAVMGQVDGLRADSVANAALRAPMQTGVAQQHSSSAVSSAGPAQGGAVAVGNCIGTGMHCNASVPIDNAAPASTARVGWVTQNAGSGWPGGGPTAGNSSAGTGSGEGWSGRACMAMDSGAPTGNPATEAASGEAALTAGRAGDLRAALNLSAQADAGQGSLHGQQERERWNTDDAGPAPHSGGSVGSRAGVGRLRYDDSAADAGAGSMHGDDTQPGPRGGGGGERDGRVAAAQHSTDHGGHPAADWGAVSSAHREPSFRHREPSFGHQDGWMAQPQRREVLSVSGTQSEGGGRGNGGGGMALAGVGPGTMCERSEIRGSMWGSTGDIPALISSASPDRFRRTHEVHARESVGLSRSRLGDSSESAWREEVFSGLAAAEAALDGAAPAVAGALGRAGLPPRWNAPQRRGGALAYDDPPFKQTGVAGSGSTAVPISMAYSYGGQVEEGGGGGGGAGGGGDGELQRGAAATALQRLACEPVSFSSSVDLRTSGALF
eukprot:jgi/Ulvmu1/5447/UM224_0002.1